VILAVRLAALLALGLCAAPLAAGAQTGGKLYRIGVLDTVPMASNVANLDAFRQGLRELGYVEGQSFVIEYRTAAQTSAFADLARELVRSKVDLILTRGGAVAAAKDATTTIPIVMAASGDPVGSGVVAGLARPGGNVTGLSALTAEVAGKRLQLLKEAIPSIQRVAAVLGGGSRRRDRRSRTRHARSASSRRSCTSRRRRIWSPRSTPPSSSVPGPSSWGSAR
jgi:putative ABC transport system substrate-binding protein